MFVRILEAQEILPALHLVWDVFAADVAPYYEPAGVAEFQKFIKYENVMPGVQKGETVFFGAWEGQELCGVSALNLRQGGHIALLFVRKEWQLRGVGRTLYQEMCRFCVQRLRINRITVNAATAIMGCKKPRQSRRRTECVLFPWKLFSPAICPGMTEKRRKGCL